MSIPEANGDPATATIPRIVAGFGRSGTTWVQDALAQSNLMRAVFEPLHPRHVQGADVFAHRCVLANDAEQELRDFLSPFLLGEFHSLWADYRIDWPRVRPRLRDFSSPQQLTRYIRVCSDSGQNIVKYRRQRRYGSRITKFVRANMMLGWIKKSFDARIVFIIRHPAAVILSQKNAPRAWNAQSNIERYRRDERLLEAIDEDTGKLLFKKLGDIEALALSWCIENKVALRQCRESDIPVVYYETLIDSGRKEWQRILAALALDVVPDDSLIAQPSQQAWGDKAQSTLLVQQYASWMKRIDQPAAFAIQDMLNATGIHFYSVDKPTPIPSTSEAATPRGDRPEM